MSPNVLKLMKKEQQKLNIFQQTFLFWQSVFYFIHFKYLNKLFMGFSTKRLTQHTIGLFLFVLQTACYIKDSTFLKIQYIDQNIEFTVQGAGNGTGLNNMYIAQTDGTKAFVVPEQTLPGFDLKAELKKIGLPTTDIENAVKTMEIDTLKMSINPSDMAIAGADFHYLNNLKIKLGAKQLASYTSNETPPKITQSILFQKGDNIKDELLSGQALKININGEANSIPQNSFRVRLYLRIKIVAEIPFKIGS